MRGQQNNVNKYVQFVVDYAFIAGIIFASSHYAAVLGGKHVAESLIAELDRLQEEQYVDASRDQNMTIDALLIRDVAND